VRSDRWSWMSASSPTGVSCWSPPLASTRGRPPTSERPAAASHLFTPS